MRRRISHSGTFPHPLRPLSTTCDASCARNSAAAQVRSMSTTKRQSQALGTIASTSAARCLTLRRCTVYLYGMRFAVVPLRYLGRILPRGEVANRSPWVGDLRVEELRDEQLMRYVRMARVLVLDRPRQATVLGELLEPQIVAMSRQAFTLWGIRTHRRAAVRAVVARARCLAPGAGYLPARISSSSRACWRASSSTSPTAPQRSIAAISRRTRSRVASVNAESRGSIAGVK